MTKSVSLIGIENTIERLELPAFHPRAYPINERRSHYFDAELAIDDLYDYSGIDDYLYHQLLNRLVHAYVNGGL